MYSIYSNLLSDHILKEIEYKRQEVCRIEYVGGVPFIAVGNSGLMIGIEDETIMVIYELFSNMLVVFCGDKYKVSNELAYICNSIDNTKININWEVFWGDIHKYGGWDICELDDLLLYEIIGESANRFLLLLLFDPLAFISRMRVKINGSSFEVWDFFSTIESNIEDMVYVSIVKYFLLGQLEGEWIVNDIVLWVMDLWIALEILEVEKKLKI